MTDDERAELERLRAEIRRRDRWQQTFMSMVSVAWLASVFFGQRAGWFGIVLGAIIGWWAGGRK